jgi:hypothetical protein
MSQDVKKEQQSGEASESTNFLSLDSPEETGLDEAFIEHFTKLFSVCPAGKSKEERSMISQRCSHCHCHFQSKLCPPYCG